MFNFGNRQQNPQNFERSQEFTSLDRSEIVSILRMFERYTKQYGCSSNTAKEFRREVDSLMRQKVVSQKNRDYAYEILGMKRTNQIKWNITLDRLQSLSGTITYIESDPYGKNLMAVYEGQDRCQVLPIIKTLYREDYLKFKVRYRTARVTGANVLSDAELKTNRYNLNREWYRGYNKG